MDERIEKLRVDYDLDPKDFWELPQKRGTWMILHKAIEVIAAKAGVIFDMPTILDSDSANGRTALIVRGTLGDRSEWSIGECNPKNNRNSYPWAMSEKRAKDRVVLKLVGLHGLVYSEDEMSDARSEGPSEPFDPVIYPNPPTRPSGLPQAGYRKDGARTAHSLKREQPNDWPDFERELNEVVTVPRLTRLAFEWSAKTTTELWPPEWRDLARERINQRRQEILTTPVEDNDDFPGDRP